MEEQATEAMLEKSLAIKDSLKGLSKKESLSKSRREREQEAAIRLRDFLVEEASRCLAELNGNYISILVIGIVGVTVIAEDAMFMPDDTQRCSQGLKRRDFVWRCVQVISMRLAADLFIVFAGRANGIPYHLARVRFPAAILFATMIFEILVTFGFLEQAVVLSKYERGLRKESVNSLAAFFYRPFEERTALLWAFLSGVSVDCAIICMNMQGPRLRYENQIVQIEERGMNIATKRALFVAFWRSVLMMMLLFLLPDTLNQLYESMILSLASLPAAAAFVATFLTGFTYIITLAVSTLEDTVNVIILKSLAFALIKFSATVVTKFLFISSQHAQKKVVLSKIMTDDIHTTILLPSEIVFRRTFVRSHTLLDPEEAKELGYTALPFMLSGLYNLATWFVAFRSNKESFYIFVSVNIFTDLVFKAVSLRVSRKREIMKIVGRVVPDHNRYHAAVGDGPRSLCSTSPPRESHLPSLPTFDEDNDAKGGGHANIRNDAIKEVNHKETSQIEIFGGQAAETEYSKRFSVSERSNGDRIEGQKVNLLDDSSEIAGLARRDSQETATDLDDNSKRGAYKATKIASSKKHVSVGQSLFTKLLGVGGVGDGAMDQMFRTALFLRPGLRKLPKSHRLRRRQAVSQNTTTTTRKMRDYLMYEASQSLAEMVGNYLSIITIGIIGFAITSEDALFDLQERSRCSLGLNRKDYIWRCCEVIGMRFIADLLLVFSGKACGIPYELAWRMTFGLNMMVATAFFANTHVAVLVMAFRGVAYFIEPDLAPCPARPYPLW
ncbi:hypothetical protein HDU67_007194 [Dinochytrium kinnereticum]|nr:hypothetical protein HDU67_007194 [Dinochytrium kinnereticum]